MIFHSCKNSEPWFSGCQFTPVSSVQRQIYGSQFVWRNILYWIIISSSGKNISDISQRGYNAMIENPFILIHCDSFHKTERQTIGGVIIISLSTQVRVAGPNDISPSLNLIQNY